MSAGEGSTKKIARSKEVKVRSGRDRGRSLWSAAWRVKAGVSLDGERSGVGGPGREDPNSEGQERKGKE